MNICGDARSCIAYLYVVLHGSGLLDVISDGYLICNYSIPLEIIRRKNTGVMLATRVSQQLSTIFKTESQHIILPNFVFSTSMSHVVCITAVKHASVYTISSDVGCRTL